MLVMLSNNIVNYTFCIANHIHVNLLVERKKLNISTVPVISTRTIPRITRLCATLVTLFHVLYLCFRRIVSDGSQNRS